MKRPIRTRVNALAIAASMVLLISSHTANAQNVGIGTPTPGSKLSVAGNAVIGSGYAGLAGPTDGLAVQGNVGIGTPTPAGDAGLDINFTDKGLLIPRVSLTNTGTYGLTGGGPTTSMLVYNTNAGITGTGAAGEGFYYWNGTRWTKLLVANTPSDAWLTLGNAGTTPGTHFIGTTDNKDLVFKTNNTEWMRILSNGNVGIGTTKPERILHIGNGKLGTTPYFRSLVFSQAGGLGIYGEYIGFNAMLNTRVVPHEFIKLAGGMVGNGDQRGGAVIVTDFYGNMLFQMYDAGQGYDTLQKITTYAPQIVFTNTGNVGIGTTAPTQRLHVAGDARIGLVTPPGPNNTPGWGDALIFSGGPTAGGSWDSDNSDPLWIARYNVADNQTELRIVIGDDNPSNGIAAELDKLVVGSTNKPNPTFTKNITWYPLFTVRSDGNVGIGTTEPIGRLDVRGGHVLFERRFQLGSTYPTWINDPITGFSEPAQATDAFVFVPGYTGVEDSDLRLYILDNSNDRFSIWGNSCGGGNCDELNAASLAHYFEAGGNAYHKGNVGIGTTAPAHKLELSVDDAAKPGTSTWTVVSDERLKNIVGKYSKGLKEILQLNPVLYSYKNSDKRTFAEPVLKTQNVGFSAQEVQKVFPEAVSTDPDGYLNLNMHAIIVAYANAIKELKAEIDKLTTVNEQLTIQNAELKSRLERIEQMLGTMAAKNN